MQYIGDLHKHNKLWTMFFICYDIIATDSCDNIILMVKFKQFLQFS